MVNTDKLRGLLAEKKVTQRELSGMLGLALHTVNSRLNGASDFRLSEVRELCRVLGLKDSKQIVDIFLR